MDTPTDDATGRADRDAGRGDDWARSLASVVLFVGVVAAVVGVILPANQATQRTAQVSVTVTGETPAEVTGAFTLPDGAHLTPTSDTVALVVDDLPRPLAALTELDDLVAGLLTLAGAWLLHRVLRDIAAGRPFAPRTPDRIGGLALTVAAMAVLPEAVRTIATLAVLERAGIAPDVLGSAFDLDLAPLLVAAILGVVAGVFRRGAQLAADVEGLV